MGKISISPKKWKLSALKIEKKTKGGNVENRWFCRRSEEERKWTMSPGNVSGQLLFSHVMKKLTFDLTLQYSVD